MILRLGALENQTDTRERGTISVLLSALCPVEAGKSAVTNSRQNIKSSGIANYIESVDVKSSDYLSALGAVVSKLDALVKIIDQTALVGITKFKFIVSETYATLMI